MKKKYLKEIENLDEVDINLLIIKRLAVEGDNIILILADKTGETKATLKDKGLALKEGDILNVKGIMKSILNISEYEKVENADMSDFLPTYSGDIDNLLKEMEEISKEEFKSIEAKTLDDYFFKDEAFIEKFKKGIGGVRQHHNYRGGLAEHTLNVMKTARALAERYDIRYKEIAILAAKLHDIGKTEEYFVDGPFSFTLRGEMEGHIVIGVNMLEEAFRESGITYSEDFKERMKGCIVQHHGKLEYGSPITPKTEEAFILNYADSIDAMMNKISSLKVDIEPNTWSDYDRRVGTKLYL